MNTSPKAKAIRQLNRASSNLLDAAQERPGCFEWRAGKALLALENYLVHGESYAPQLAGALDELLAADDFNFGHDVGGIRRHINRETGELEDCFVPRFTAREVAPA